MRLRLTEQMTKLNEQCANAEKTFGTIYSDLKQLIVIMTKVMDYYLAKDDPSDQKDVKNQILPLFPTIDEPSDINVGHLIDLKCGHTQRPSDLETVMFSVHLEEAGFYKKPISAKKPSGFAGSG